VQQTLIRKITENEPEQLLALEQELLLVGVVQLLERKLVLR